ncbi:MAG: 16S rRNA (cytidine(1402)-2'-O)-methyltransferase [Myxococcota bacterium]|nr:16S rRNA (cytidine(1402)-2'-O)-methyltransferase [Myxococcota bacterium]
MKSTKRVGTLFVVGTPIGNLKDITLRALEVLSEVHAIAAEDTRVTKKLLLRHGITGRLVSIREHNARTAIPKILDALISGNSIALVTDAGTPSVSDPGADLVNRAHEVQVPVVPIPGASALATAVSIAGLSGDGVRFLGFLPRSGRRRKERIQALKVETGLTVLYESPHRLKQTLTDLADVCGTRQACVMRELTKIHEEITRGTLAAVRDKYRDAVKGEITIAIEGATDQQEDPLSEGTLRALIRQEIGKGKSAKDIATALARGLGQPRKKIYDLTVDELAG